MQHNEDTKVEVQESKYTIVDRECPNCHVLCMQKKYETGYAFSCHYCHMHGFISTAVGGGSGGSNYCKSQIIGGRMSIRSTISQNIKNWFLNVINKFKKMIWKK